MDAAIIKGWYSYLEDPAPDHGLIQQDNPEVSDDQLAFGVENLQEYGIILSGDSEAMGIGAMTDKRWEELYTTMVEVGGFPEGVPYQEAYSLGFVNQGPEAYQG